MSERSIFLSALDFQDAAERLAYVDQACGDDPKLRAEVDALLRSHNEAGAFLATPAAEQVAAAPLPTVLLDDSAGPSLPVNPTETTAATAADPDDDHIAGLLSLLQPSDQPGSLGRIAQYDVKEVLGRGAFGIVLRAFDEKLHRMVAIKAMNPELAATSPPRKRFLREARSSAKVRHENIVGIHDIQEQPVPYLVMDYIPGQTLQQRLEEHGPLDVPEVLRIGQQIATGLAAAHAQGLIHRDIKPANILIESGIEERAKITDFGLARAADDASLTQSGLIAGTPMFMAPEQARGEALDHRTDLFSLGSVLYTMVSGRPPFRAPNTIAVLKRVCEDTPRPIQEVIPETPQWLCDIIDKLHAKEPEDRFQSAKEVADVLGQHLAHWQQPHEAPRPAPIEPVSTANRPSNQSPSPRHRRVPVWLMVLGLVLLVPVTLYTFAQGVLGWRMIAFPSGLNTVTSETAGTSVSPTEAIPTESQRSSFDPDRRAAEWVLSIGGTIKITENGREREIKIVGDLPREVFELTLVGLGHTKASDADLSHFRDCYNLTQLHLVWIPVSDAGLAHFKDRKNVTVLSLEGTGVTDAGLAYFKDCQNLTLLNLSYSGVSDAGLAHFKDCKNLTYLNFANTSVGDAGLAHFENRNGLTDLVLDGTKVSDTGLVHFRDCKKLSWLGLSNTQVSNAGLAHFKDCKNLWHLNLSFTNVSDAGLVHFNDYQNLVNLFLNSTQVSDAGLAYLARGPKLNSLNVKNTKVTEAGVQKFSAALPACKIEWDGGVIEPKPSSDLDRRAAELVLSPEQAAAERDLALWIVRDRRNGEPSGEVEVRFTDHQRGSISVAAEMPKMDFRVVGVRIAHAPTDEDFARLARHSTLERIETADPANARLSVAALWHAARIPELHSLQIHSAKLQDADLDALAALPALRVLRLNQSGLADEAVSRLQRHTELEQLHLSFNAITDAGLVHISQFPSLKALSLTGCLITSGGLRHIAECASLKGLWVSGTVVESDGFREICRLTQLEQLACSSGRLQPGALAPITALRNLRTLDLNANAIDDRDVAYLSELQELRTLQLAETQITDASLKIVAGLGKLSELSLTGSQITDGGLIHIAGCRQLREVGLAKTSVTQAGVDRLRNALPQCRIVSDLGTFEPTTSDPDRRAAEWVLSIGGGIHIKEKDQSRQIGAVGELPRGAFELTDVNLDRNQQVSDAGLVHFRDCKNLLQLDLGGTQLTDAGLVYFKESKQLTALGLNDAQVTDAGLAHFEEFKNLTHLYLGATRVSDAGLAHFKDCKNLRVLHLGNTKVSDAGLAHLQDCKNLTSLDLRNTKVSDAGLAYFKDCKSIAVLQLYGPKVSDAGLAHFKDCKSLTYLDLYGTQVSDAGLADFAGCPQLSFVNVKNTKVTEAGAKKLSAALPECKIEWYGGVIEPTPSQWTSLFNGRDLTGWQPPQNRDDWKVENGMLVGRCSANDSFLFSQQDDWQDFHLRVEAKINPNGDSGLFFRMQSDEHSRPVSSANEIQVTGIPNYQFATGSLFQKSPVAPGTADLVRPDEWFTLEVIVQGPQLTVRVNDQKVLEHVLDAATIKPGRLALQAWSSQTVVQFRKVEIKRLPPTFAVAPFDAAQAKHYQDGWAKHLGLPVETTNSLGMQLRLVPPGEFLMGSLDSDKSALPMEKPQHKVRLGKPFYAGVHEVTVAQFRAFVEATAYQTDAEREDAGSWHFIDIPQKGRNTAWTWKTPGFEQTDRHPVCCVTGHDADRFCTWLSVKEGEHYRLPSEAEWEYACGAGTTTPYHFGTEMDLDQMRMVSTTGSAAVGSYAPNAFGLCDTHGNVFEWCFDGRRSYKSAPLIVDPLGPVGPEIPRVVRGGGWTSSKKLATGRTTARLVTCTPDRPFHGLGFRVVRVIDPVEATEAFAPASAVEPENVR